MLKTDPSEKSWQIVLITESKDCPSRYMKWNPPKDGWYCKETDRRCSLNKCPQRLDGRRVSQNHLSTMTTAGHDFSKLIW
ncbi:MAG: hypothetical protein PVJ69_04780 [Desulfobacteraceae bacterium]|jgi:hypothetical protein